MFAFASTYQNETAKDVCSDAALYFDPLEPGDMVEKIKKIINNKILKQKLVEKGKKRVKRFETAHSRAEKYIMLCENVVRHTI